MTMGRVAVLRPGDWVHFDGGEHQVVALAGTSVRLRSEDGAEQVVLGVHLMASPGFAVVDGAPAPTVEPFGLLDSLPPDVLDAARQWERHVLEIETGLLPGASAGAVPRPGYDPAMTTVVQRDHAKAAELGVGVRTVQTRRARYAQQGLWGLVDQRASLARPPGCVTTSDCWWRNSNRHATSSRSPSSDASNAKPARPKSSPPRRCSRHQCRSRPPSGALHRTEQRPPMGLRHRGHNDGGWRWRLQRRGLV